MSNLIDRQRAFELFCQGMKPADIARELNYTPNTLSAWKKEDKWDERAPSDRPVGLKRDDIVPDQGKMILEKIKTKLLDALEDEKIKPAKWKDLVETLNVLTKEVTAPKGRRQQELDVTELPDNDLDKEIEELTRLVDKRDLVEDAIVVKADVVVE